VDEGALVEHEVVRDGARLLQRRLLVWIALATLLTWGIVIADLERGGRPDPSTLRAAAILLDGHWRFRTGDDARWADASADDSDWETVDLTATPGSHDGDVGLPDYVGGWMAHGHPRHTGYAWYRREVNVPAGSASWDVLGPTLVEDGYELYWNGQLLGGSGKLGPHPRVVGTRPLRFALPADAAGTRGVLALRAFMLSRQAPSADGGPSPQQRDRRLDRSDGSADLLVAGDIHVDADGGRLDAGVESLAPAPVAHHRCVGARDRGRRDHRRRDSRGKRD